MPNPLAVFQSFVSKVGTILPMGFNQPDKNVKLTSYEGMSGIASWMQKEKFLSFQGMLVSVPPGFNTYIIDHLKALESVWGELKRINEDVLSPIAAQLAKLSHEPGMLTIPVGFKYKDFKFPLKNIDPADLVNQLSASYNNTVITQRVIEKTYHSATEIDAAYTRAKLLFEEIDKGLRKDISRQIDAITFTAGQLEDLKIHPQCLNQISIMLDAGSAWVELFGLFMKQVNELVQAMDDTAERLKELQQNRK